VPAKRDLIWNCIFVNDTRFLVELNEFEKYALRCNRYRHHWQDWILKGWDDHAFGKSAAETFKSDANFNEKKGEYGK